MPFDRDGGHEAAAYDTPSAFNPYDPPKDPESVQPSHRPDPPNVPGLPEGTSGADGEPPTEAPQGPEMEEEQDAPRFDERHRENFVGLLYLGRLQKTFPLFGHTFVVRTLTTEHLAEIGQIVKPHEGSLARNAVYQAAFVAAAVVTVDGKPLPGSLSGDTSMEVTEVRFPYVMANWMPAVREGIYNEAFRLEIEARDVLAALGEASG